MKLGNLPVYQSRYLKAADLQGRTVRVTIQKVSLEEFYDRERREQIQQAVLWFQGKQKGLVINKTRLTQLIEIFGSDETDQYLHQPVVLHPTKQRGKDTVAISAAHGIGLEKRRFLSITRSDAEIEIMKRLKRTLDPKNILNPGKVVDLDGK